MLVGKLCLFLALGIYIFHVSLEPSKPIYQPRSSSLVQADAEVPHLKLLLENLPTREMKPLVVRKLLMSE